MTLSEELDELIKLHAEYHMGRQGLSDYDFKELLIKLIHAQMKKIKLLDSKE